MKTTETKDTTTAIQKEYLALYFHLPPKVAKQAADNLKAEKHQPVANPKHLVGALIMGFDWDGTPEGEDYWEGILNNVESRAKRGIMDSKIVLGK